ncbi:MAG: hypothetical protein HY234_05930 [Acidobacteria bacterium]|nr:hypothetical protein [Acidobacteriota bacterium]MBI3662575.1 hypothetical protein [Acidobacteriota bacterium]
MQCSTQTRLRTRSKRVCRTARGRRGFSALELVISVSVILTMAALSLPSMARMRRFFQLSSTAAGVTNMVKFARFEAVRLNRSTPPLAWRTQPLGNTTVVWVDADGDGVLDNTEPQFVLPVEVQFLAQSAVPSATSMGFASTQVVSGPISFDARGMVDYGAALPVVYVMFFGFPSQPNEGFRAISVTPFGKTQVWIAERGGAWRRL